MYRVATLDSIQPDALAELERVMQKQIKANAAVRSSTIGGASAAARIMNHVRGGADRRINGALTGIDEDIGQTLQDQMFIFDNLISLAHSSLTTLLRSLDNTPLVPALQSAPDEHDTTKRQRKP